MHNLFFKICNNSKLFEIRIIFNHIFLLINKLIIFFIIYFKWEFICIIIQINEAIIEEKSMITFFTITIINLFSSFDIFHCFNNETLSIISISPSCLSRSSMIQHICICYESISLYSFYLNPKYST